jgi:hypothetical protein
MRLTERELRQIDAAVNAHGKWITELRIAIEEGSSAFDPEIVRTDNHCAFGKWLYDDFPKSPESRQLFDDIRDKHAKFHRMAANILQLAISGHAEAALKLMDYKGEFMRLSGELILLLKGFRAH